MKILVLGSSGMAGHVITIYMSERGYDVTNVAGHKRLNPNTIIIDVTQKQLLDEYLNSNSFDVIINCIGLLVGPSEARKDLAVYLNSFIPHYLEHKYLNSLTKIIHLSTDCVYSGVNPPYNEHSEYDGTLFYDRSKALGEIINEKDLTFRMSIIGPDINEEGTGLFNWFMKQKGQISGYSNAYWTGVTTIELAKGIEKSIQQELTGLYHLVPNYNITKLELLMMFKEVLGKEDVTINAFQNKRVDKTLINTRTDFNHKIPGYTDMILHMKTWIDDHKVLYPHYVRNES